MSLNQCFSVLSIGMPCPVCLWCLPPLTQPGLPYEADVTYPRSLGYLGRLTQTFANLISSAAKLVFNKVIKLRVFRCWSVRAHILRLLYNGVAEIWNIYKIWRIQAAPDQKQLFPVAKARKESWYKIADLRIFAILYNSFTPTVFFIYLKNGSNYKNWRGVFAYLR